MNFLNTVKAKFFRGPNSKQSSKQSKFGKGGHGQGGKASASSPKRYSASELGIDSVDISAAAMMVCKTLQQHGYDGYLVGGCVRDWLMGKHPKDFDVSTNAKPEQIKPLFKRSRIIGRRFKLVHVHHQRELIEVATYRASPDESKPISSKRNAQRERKNHQVSQSGRLLRDNVYGTLADDAQRRDFTANALYFDPVSNEVIDYLGGVEDIKAKQLIIIGDAETRFSEDPVRMLRAIRFQAKLGINIPDSLQDLIHQNKHRMLEVSNARMFDETFKLFHNAHAVKSWDALKQYGFFEILFPITAKQIKADEQAETFVRRALENTDRRVGKGLPVIPAFFFAVILWHAYQKERQDSPDLPRGREGVYRAADAVFAMQYPTIAIPKRVSTVVAEIWDLQWHLSMRRPKGIAAVLENRRFRAAYDFLLLRESIGEVPSEITKWWTEIQDKNPDAQQAMIANLPNPMNKGKGRRKRRPGGQKHKTEHKSAQKTNAGTDTSLDNGANN